MFTRPVTPKRPKSARRPCAPQMTLEPTTAPDSTCLSGQIFTCARTCACSFTTERCGPDLPLEEVGIRARVLGDRPDVRPVPVGDVAEERLALGKQLWEEILAEIEDLADGVALQDARLHDVDARIDRVGEDLAP